MGYMGQETPPTPTPETYNSPQLEAKARLRSVEQALINADRPFRDTPSIQPISTYAIAVTTNDDAPSPKVPMKVLLVAAELIVRRLSDTPPT